MSKFNHLTKATKILITSAGALALIAGMSLSMAQQAYALDCLLDTNDDGNADSNVDTDGGANSNALTSSLACGDSASATSSNATALGSSASAAGLGAVALGSTANAAGSSTALGYTSSAASESVAVGHFTVATGQSSVAAGYSANATGNFSTAVGRSANATATRSTSLGYFANFTVSAGDYSTALGSLATSRGVNSIAIGADTADADNLGADAQGANSIVIGTDASGGNNARAIVIGTGASATEPDQVVLKDAGTFTILGNGNMGLGTAAPVANLDINSGAVDTTLLLNNTGAQWEMKSKASTGRLVYKNLTAGGVPFKMGPSAVNGLLSVGTATTDLVEVRGDLDVTGILTTGGPTCGGGCDAVFDADYDLPTIEEHAAQMYANKYLPQVGPTVPLAPVNVSEKMGNMLNELEKAHIYIAQIKAEHKAEMAVVEARFARLEKYLED